MTAPLRWGIMGTGNIAHQFVEGAASARRSTVAAAASRRIENANAFAAKHRIPTALGNYDQLLTDAAVDAVYVALPNSMHHEWTLKALRAGKHVLCEKPLAANAAQAQEMFDAADKAGLLLVEAFMYRSHPQTHAVLEKVRSGAIGPIRMINTSFCFQTSHTEARTNSRFSALLAGGALMDVGCYCINFSRLITGEEPGTVHGVAKLHPSGVDEYAAAALAFPGGVVASFVCGMTVQADNSAYVCGENGYLQVPVPWKPPGHQARFTLAHSAPPRMDNPTDAAAPPPQTFSVDADRPLYALEADDFAAAVLDHAAPTVTKQDTLGNMRILDELRRQVGVPF